MNNPVVHIEILGPDQPASIDFYHGLFGWEMTDRPLPGWPHHGFLRADHGIPGAVGSADAVTGSAVVIYVEVDDPQDYVDRAQALGSSVVMPATHAAEAEITLAWIKDPQGNTIGVVKNHESDSR